MKNKGKDFINRLMMQIIEGRMIPKYQVERAFSPIFMIFIEKIITNLFIETSLSNGVYELIAPEFPFKKENNQSTNIDFMLVNRENNTLCLVELKTDISSDNENQKSIYKEKMISIQKDSAFSLYEDLYTIRSGSNKTEKYDFLIEKMNPYIEILKEIYDVKLVYIVPKKLKNKLEKDKEIYKIFSFSDLPGKLNNEFDEFWEIIKEHIVKLDEIRPDKKFKLDEIGKAVIKLKIKENISSYCRNYSRNPKTVWISNKARIRPNYQVEFESGVTETFNFNGTRLKYKKFNPENLCKPIDWPDLRKMPNKTMQTETNQLPV